MQFDPATAATDLSNERGQQVFANALEVADADAPRFAVAKRPQLAHRHIEPRKDRLGVREKTLSGLRQRHALAAAGSLDEPLIERSLEAGHLLANRRLRVAEAARSSVEAAGARDRLQRTQVAQF